MKINKLIGLRTIKTAIAIIIGYFVVEQFDLYSHGFVSAAIIVSMASNISDSFKITLYRLLSTLLGVGLGLLFQYLNFVNAFSAGLGVLLIIVFCNLVKINKALILSTMIFMAVLSYENNIKAELLMYAGNRIIDTLVGGLIGVTINVLIFRPKQEQYLVNAYKHTFEQLENALLLLLDGKSINQELLINELSKISETYQVLRSEQKLKMNQHVNILDIEAMNNKIRLAISLLLDLDNINRPFTLTMESRKLINDYFEKKLFQDTNLINMKLEEHAEIALNYEVRKLISTYRDIDKNLRKLIKIYS